jgi:Flp pilus assembly protein TadD/predicted AlkP superfamily phosphohydrolase/phosphomutase
MSPHRLGLLAFAAAIAVAGCGRDDGVRDLGTRAVVIAIDGADWKIIDRLAAEGGMPNLAALKPRSAWGEIETLRDIALSPVIWTSVATGKTAAEHGITWFMVDRPDGTRVPIRSHNRKVKAIWNILAEHRRRPVTLGWWATFPAEDVGRGAMVSDALGFHGFGATARGGDDREKTHPPELFARLDPLVPPEQQLQYDFVRRFVHISPADYRREMFDPARFPERDPENPIHLFQQYATTARGYAAIAEELLQSRPYDLFMVYFEQVDSLSHLFMKYDPPRLAWIGDDEAYERYRDVVREWYRYQDEILGRLLAKIDLDDTAVFILSDHGFKSGERRIRSRGTVDVRRAHLDHERRGIFLAAGPHIRSGVEIEGASVLDLTPTLLHYLGFPVAKDMDGKVLEDLFEEGFAGKHPIRYVTTYEDAGAAGTATAEAQDAGDDQDAAEAEKNLAALRSLGYLGEAPADAGAVAATPAPPESSPEVHNNLGLIHLRNGDLEAAREEFQKALELDAADADALLNLAAIHRAEGRLGAAEHLVERALQVDPSSTGALSQLAELKRAQGDLDEAVRLFEEALRIDDSLPSLSLGYGDVLQRARRFPEAERAFESVLELDPDSFKARYNLGVTYGRQGRTSDAVAMYEEALEVAPEHPEAVKAHNNLGVIDLERGEIDGARRHFEAAVRASAGHFESRHNLALIYLDDGRLEDAIKLLEDAAAMAPNHEQVTVRLGMAYLQAMRGEDAYRSLLLVRRLYPDNWRAPLGLAVLYARAEKPDEAARLLAQALELGGEEARARAAGFPLLRELL